MQETDSSSLQAANHQVLDLRKKYPFATERVPLALGRRQRVHVVENCGLLASEEAGANRNDEEVSQVGPLV